MIFNRKGSYGKLAVFFVLLYVPVYSISGAWAEPSLIIQQYDQIDPARDAAAFAAENVVAENAVAGHVAAGNVDSRPHAKEQCVRCHSHDKLLANNPGLIKTLNKCQSCHVNSSVGTNASVSVLVENKLSNNKSPVRQIASQGQLSSEQAQQQLQLKQQIKHPEKKLDKQAGMQFPMYSQESRLGDEPNEMVLIPAGQFIMGSDNRLPDEGPKHTVKLGAYYIDKFEVTNFQYKKFNDETNRRSPSHFRNRTFPQGKADHPVVYVSWEDANAYCQWAGKRLPTDQEWEKAARGSDGRIFPWGNEFDFEKANTPLRWQQVGAFGDTTPVGAFKNGVSPYGVYDMSGNVWEWTDSWYQPYPGNKVASESYGERYKTLKGGSWFDCSFYNCGISAPVFNRAFFSVHTKNDSFGFRCARDAD